MVPLYTMERTGALLKTMVDTQLETDYHITVINYQRQ